MKSTFSFIFILCLIQSLFNACGDKKPEWQGLTEEVDGVKVITNPNEPIYGELTFELEEDLTIGNKSLKNYCR